MFYSTQVLTRKGPLRIVWLAAHLDGRLKRNKVRAARTRCLCTCGEGVRPWPAPAQVDEASIPITVDALLNPEAPLALRLSGQLMLGVMRIYARKVDFLHQVRREPAFSQRMPMLPGEGSAGLRREPG